MKANRFIFAAGFVFAMALMFFACSSDDGGGNTFAISSSSEDAGTDNSSSSGIGTGETSSSSIAKGNSSSSTGADETSSSCKDEGASSSSVGEGDSSSSVEGKISSSSVANGDASSSFEETIANPSSSSITPSSSSVSLKECTGIFNLDNKFCYDGVVYDKCDGMEYDPTSYYCQGGVAYPAVCNGVAYNPLLNQKCEGGIVKEPCIGGSHYPYYNPATEYCLNSVIYSCENLPYNPATQRCKNKVVETKCGTGWYNHETHFCDENHVFNKCNEEYNPATEYCSNGTDIKIYGYVTDGGGQIYKTVEIGNQLWMAENLNYNISDSKCYDDIATNCGKYGRLYDWAAANNACPSGWHLPSNTEWDKLITAAGGLSKAGSHFKATEGWYNCGSSECMDTYGFAALPGGGGYRSTGGIGIIAGTLNFYNLESYANFWSATASGSVAYGYRIYSDSEYVNSSTYDTPTLFSVRCVQDD